MQDIEILYDHYKESNNLIQNFRENRGKKFKKLCLAILFNLLFLIYPNDIVDSINQLLNNNYSISVTNTFTILQSTLWFVTVYYLIQYLHSNIYMERQYKYLHKLEEEISDNTNLKSFTREGENYLNEYPLILDVLDVFYKWIIPIGIVIITGIKIYFEFINKFILVLKIIDTTCFVFIFILIILYLKMLHFPKEKKKNNKKQEIDVNLNIKLIPNERKH